MVIITIITIILTTVLVWRENNSTTRAAEKKNLAPQRLAPAEHSLAILRHQPAYDTDRARQTDSQTDRQARGGAHSPPAY
jgi:hypothetical protein